jgi:hypothetical protein
MYVVTEADAAAIREAYEAGGTTFAATATGCSGVGAQPAIHRAWFFAMALSVIPGNRRRSSTAADASPSRWYTSRIAAASASVTTYM